MTTILKAVVVVLMVVTWLVTGLLLAFFTPSFWGKIATGGIGIIINIMLAFAYSCIGQRPASFRDWFKM
ncbi:hypothetical protein [Larkinella rosea]|uniref:Uncharacterized protein n=1 Tax=Larkinella rosea TaxID=2025312 RepID=A0A3P1BU15_9BACT|nr:hypothetical protein [Larkinella rosea]RRB04601.1 hypothetical protein EHT25_14045 [Larkinella rosea]